MAKKKDSEEAVQADKNLMKELNTKYGKGSVILGSDTVEDLEVVDSGSITLNRATEIGGIPIGKLIEMYGPESAGKTTLALHIIANFQKEGKKVALIDGEQSFDRKYATNLGVKVDELLIVQPSCGEEGYNIAIDLIKSGEISLVVIDSHTSLIPQKVVEANVGEATIGLQARINSIAIGKIHPMLKPFNCTVLALSQLRTNIGGYGDPNVPTGGQAYKFYSDMRLKVSKSLEKADSLNRTTVEIVKNKCGVPFGKATFAINWGSGIDRLQEIVDLSVENGSISRKGAGWYEISTKAVIASADGETKEVEDIIKLQGDTKVKAFLTDNPEFLTELEYKITNG
jgi:recombination protein RecA